MEKYKKISKHTWVLSNKANVLEQRQREWEAKKNKELKENQNKRTTDVLMVLYKRICREIFEERDFICKAEFNKIIKQEINADATYYRNRMIDLELIYEKNNLIKPHKITIYGP